MNSNISLNEPVSGKMQSLSQDVLEEIFSYLQYVQVSELGRECKTFRQAARSVLYRALGKIMTRIENEVTKIEEITKSQHEHHLGDVTSVERIHLAALMTILKMCASELRIINVCCGRYMRDREFDFCFPAGDLLDDFDGVVKVVRGQTGEKDKRVDDDVTTSLFIKTGKFLDYFDSTLEMAVAREVPLGVTLLDILGCSQASDFVVELAHSEGRSCHRLKGRYELRDTGTVDKPPEFTEYLLPVQVKVLIRYLRNYVRWNNLFDSLHKLWDLEEETLDLNNNMSDKTEDTKQFFEDLAKKRTGYTRKHISDTGDICRDLFQQSNSSLESPMGVTVEFSLCSRELPMSLETLKDGHIKCVVSEKDSKDACIQTELSYVEVVEEDEEVLKNEVDLTGDVDPDKVLDYVQNVKTSLHNVRHVVDQLSNQSRPETANKRPETAGLDSSTYFSSTESFKTDNFKAESTLSFPYQCSAISINGEHNTRPRTNNIITKFRGGKPSHMSIAYHCSVQSLPRDTLYAKNFILGARSELSYPFDESGSKKSSSAMNLQSQNKNDVVVKDSVRPATVSGLIDNNCKLLEKISERCVTLADRMDLDENVEEDDDKVLKKLLPKIEKEVVVIRERGQARKRSRSGSFLKRQEVMSEFEDGESFLMQMRVHYVGEDCKVREKIVKVDCSGGEVVIEVS